MPTAPAVPLRQTGPRRVVGRLRLESRVRRGGVTVPLGHFGATVTKVDVLGVRWRDTGTEVVVDGRVVVDVSWDVDGHGRTDVADAGAEAVSARTWEAVAADLAPDAGGVPRRARYWAEDISVAHEQFHAGEDLRAAARAFESATESLHRQRLTPSVDGVMALLVHVQDHLKAAIEANYRRGGEQRAYAAGKDLYARRTEAIRARARAEGWAGHARQQGEHQRHPGRESST